MIGNRHCFIVADTGPINAPFRVAGSLLLGKGQYFVVTADSIADTGPSTESPSVAEVLTSRELQVVMLVCKGQLNKQIAHQLRLSEWTVSTHLRRVYLKLGVKTRAALVAKMINSIHPAK